MKKIFFDFNGTIINDMPIWRAAMEKTFKTYGKEPPSTEQYFAEMKKDYLEIYRYRGITATRDEINAIYVPEYNRLVHTAGIFDGVFNTLYALKKKGVILGLLTLQPEEMVTPLLKKFLLDDIFTVNCTEYHCKDKTKAIVQISETTGTNLKDVCLVGDTPSDVNQGKEAKVRTAAFLTGHLPRSLFEENPPNHLFTSFSQILRLIDK